MNVLMSCFSVFTYNDNISATWNLHCWRLFTHYIAVLYIPQPSIIGTASQTNWADLQNKLLFLFLFMLYLMTLSVSQDYTPLNCKVTGE
jgi:hypothetical protein